MLTQERLMELLRYDQESGIFVRIKNLKPAATLRVDGYLEAMADGKIYYLHRLAWLYVHGEWPSDDIDHINGIRSDNRIANLRSVSRAVNLKNMKMPKTNTSGTVGVSRDKSGYFIAGIYDNGKYIYRYFGKKASAGCKNISLNKAIEWRKKKEKEIGYHANHGRQQVSEITYTH